MPQPTQGFPFPLFLIKHFQIGEHAHVELHIIFNRCLHSFEFLLYLILSAYTSNAASHYGYQMLL